MSNVHIAIHLTRSQREVVVVRVDRLADFNDKRELMGTMEHAAEHFEHVVIETGSSDVIESVCSKASSLRKDSRADYTRSFTRSGVSFRFYDRNKLL